MNDATVPASGGPISDEVERALTQAMREADELFESGKTGGGGTRHYLRDCFYDALERHGLAVVSRAVLTQQEAALREAEKRRDAMAAAVAAETVRGALAPRVANEHHTHCSSLDLKLSLPDRVCDCYARVSNAAFAALDELVLLHTRQEAALRNELMPLVAEARRLSNNKDLAASQVFYAVDNVRMWLEAALAALSPPPVASGETAEEAQFTPEAWEKLTQQHQAFLARRSVASGTEGEDG